MRGKIIKGRYWLFLLFLAPLTALGQGSNQRDSTSDTTTLGRATEVHIGSEGITIVKGGGGKVSTRIYIDQDKLSKFGSLESLKSEGGDIVRFGEDIAVKVGELVNGDVVSIGGNIRIAGTVVGDVTAVGGDVIVESTGIIRGDAVSIGGKVVKEPGAQIRGSRIGTHFPPKFIFRWGTKGWYPPSSYHPKFPPGVWFGLLLFFVFLCLSLLITLFLPDHIQRINASIEREFLKAGLVGFLAYILILPIFVMLCITIIGIPVAFLIEPIVIFVAMLMGIAGFSLFLGGKINQTTSLKLSSPLTKVLVGWIIIELPGFLGILFRVGGNVFLFLPISWVFFIIGSLVGFIVWTVGFGAVFLTRFGTRESPPPRVQFQEASPTKPPAESKEAPKA